LRPTSIIFLCLAVLLIVGGIVTCYIAAGMARDEGIELFESAESAGGKSEIIQLAEDGLNKISLILKDADVSIYGGAAEPYVELVNYKPGSYSYGMANGILTVDESIGILQLLNFGESKVNFGGLRQYLVRRDTETGRKSINVYLPDTYLIKHIEVKLDSGNISVNKVKNRSDFSLKIANGNLLFEGNSSNSAITLDIGTGDAVFRDSALLSLNAALKRGDLSYFAYNFAYQTYEITTGGGAVYVEGVDKGETYTSSTPMAFIKINAEVKNGDVYLGTKDPNAPEDAADSETTADLPPETAGETTAG
jgi:hypothetical protein